jgi:hypothetical protein
MGEQITVHGGIKRGKPAHYDAHCAGKMRA